MRQSVWGTYHSAPWDKCSADSITGPSLLPILLPLTPQPSHTCRTDGVFPGQTFKYFSLGSWAPEPRE